MPAHWRKYKVRRVMAVSEWIPNFARRLAQLESISQLQSFSGIQVWLGGLFFPEAYVTATRQAVAHRMSWSLETLNLRLDVEQTGDTSAFIVEGIFSKHVLVVLLTAQPGLTIEGAAWSTDHLALNDGDAVRIGASQLRWVHESEAATTELRRVNLPVYLNADRSDVLFTVDLPFDGASASLAAMRAICLTAGG